MITLRFCPRMVTSASTNCCTLSKSHSSPGTIWKCHLYWPVSGFTATTEQAYRLSLPLDCLRTVRHPLPHGGAAAQLPPLAFPGCRGLLHGFVLETLRGIARHRIKLP